MFAFYGIKCVLGSWNDNVLTFWLPIRACVHLSRTPSGAPLTNNLGEDPSFVGFRGTQYVDMDLRSRENSRVNSFFHLVSISCLTTMAVVRLSRPDFGTSNGFNFSANTIRAVSVASPTWANKKGISLTANQNERITALISKRTDWWLNAFPNLFIVWQGFSPSIDYYH